MADNHDDNIVRLAQFQTNQLGWLSDGVHALPVLANALIGLTRRRGRTPSPTTRCCARRCSCNRCKVKTTSRRDRSPTSTSASCRSSCSSSG